MPQKAFERGIYHVMAYAFFSKCPKIEDFHFRYIFCFLINHVLFFEVPHFSLLDFFERPHLSHLIGIWRHFEKKSSFTYILGHFMLPPVIDPRISISIFSGTVYTLV